MNINIQEACIYLLDNVTPSILHEMGRDILTTIFIAKVFSIMPPFNATIFGIASVPTALALNVIHEQSEYERTLSKVIRIATSLIMPAMLGHMTLLAMGYSSTFAISLLLTGAVIITKHAGASAWNLFCLGGSTVTHPSEPVLAGPELAL